MEILPEISSKVRKYDTSVRDYVCVYSVHACTVVIHVVLPEVGSMGFIFRVPPASFSLIPSHVSSRAPLPTLPEMLRMGSCTS